MQWPHLSFPDCLWIQEAYKWVINALPKDTIECVTVLSSSAESDWSLQGQRWSWRVARS